MSKEDIVQCLEGDSYTIWIPFELRKIFIEKCIEFDLINNEKFYTLICADKECVEFMLKNKPDILDIDRCLQSIKMSLRPA
jgi:hypothetical protein